MVPYLIRRLLWTIVELIGISIITFALAYLVPADPARLYAGPHATLATIANIRHQLGLDRPVAVQYGDYLWRLVHLDLGTSYQLHIPVLQAIMNRVPATAELAAGGVFFELLLGVPIGIVAAARPRGIVDRAGSTFTLVGLSTPPFVLSYLLIFVVWYKLGLFESGGTGDPLPLYLFLPALALGLSGAAFYARLLRTAMLDVLRSDYIRVARAKGVPRWKVLIRHAFPNCTNVLITQLGLDIGFFLSGVLLIEVPFSWPGIGQQAWQAITNLDVPLIMGTVLFGAVAILGANIVVDVLYAFIDPRVRYE
ncbi:MAG TPA: ABC transporter permease [Chloroflexota bacterium]